MQFTLIAAVSLFLFTPLPAGTLSVSPILVIVPSPKLQVSKVARQRLRVPLAARLTERLQRWLEGRTAAGAEDDPEKADRLAKQSLSLGIISLVSLLTIWIPVVGFFLFLASLPVGILALIKGQKAKKMGSEKLIGMIFGAVSMGLFLITIILALLLAIVLLAVST